jgi:hypothetical protein
MRLWSSCPQSVSVSVGHKGESIEKRILRDTLELVSSCVGFFTL